MPEPGGLPRRSRSHHSSTPIRLTGSGVGRRDYSSSDRQPPSEQKRSGATQSSGMKDALSALSSSSPREVAKRQRLTLWQVLFGQGHNRTSRRSALQQAARKDAYATGVVLRPNLLQRLKPQSKTVSREHAASKLAETQVRQAVDGRSRQVSNWSPTSSTTAEQLKGKQLKRQDGWRRGMTQATSLQGSGLQAMTVLQSSPVDRRAQANALTLKREARERARRGESTQRLSTPDLLERTQVAERMKARPDTQSRKRDSASQPRSRSLSAGLYAARMLILSVGVGVLVGTMLSVLDPAARSSAGASQQATKKSDAAESTKAPQTASSLQSGLGEGISAVQLPKMGQELTSLKAALQALALQNPRLTPGIFLFDLDTSSYLDLNGGASFAAASTIKVPILVAFFQDVDAGKIRLDELLTMRKELVAGGSGEMQGLPVGTQFTALETVTKMITISDNTATNMVIARLGGMAALDQRFRSWGLMTTAINSLLPDLNGTNTTSPKDMALLMTRISQGELVSMRSRDRLLDIMQRTVNRSQLPQGLEKGATIAHKTGDIGGMIGDVGLIDMPNGKRYALTVLVKRSYNDDQAYDLVQKTSRTVYQFLNRAPAALSSQALIPAISPSHSSISVAGDEVSKLDTSKASAETAMAQSSSLNTAAQ